MPFRLQRLRSLFEHEDVSRERRILARPSKNQQRTEEPARNLLVESSQTRYVTARDAVEGFVATPKILALVLLSNLGLTYT